ncbi:MAG: hypothetical protein U0903_17805 [Planctomycetales bacterium]
MKKWSPRSWFRTAPLRRSSRQTSSPEALESRTLLSAQVITKAQPPGVVVTANGDSTVASISQNGQFAVYITAATNVKSGVTDSNGGNDVYLYDRVNNLTTLVSHAAGSLTTTSNGKVAKAAISADGRYVAFTCDGTNLVTGQSDANADFDLFLYDRTTGNITLVSHAAGSTTTTGDNGVRSVVINQDGQFLAYTSEATNLVTSQTDSNNGLDVFRYDRNTNTSALVSRTVSSPTTAANDTADSQIDMDQTGALIVYASRGSNIAAGQSDSNASLDVFLYTASVASNVVVSHSSVSTGAAAAGSSSAPVISADGRSVAFGTTATNLLSGATDSNGGVDIYLYNVATKANQLVSHSSSSATTAANGVSTPQLAFSADGRYLAYAGNGTDIVPGQVDVAGSQDVFLYNRDLNTSTLVSHSSSSFLVASNGSSARPSISADGRYVLFDTLGSNLLSGQSGTASTRNVFQYDSGTGILTLVSNATTGTKVGGNGDSLSAQISPDGTWTLFHSAAANLVAGDTNNFLDVFLSGSALTDRIGLQRGTTVFEDLDGSRRFTTTDTSFNFGTATDTFVVGDWNGDGIEEIAAFRNGQWYLDANGNRKWDGTPSDKYFSFGTAGDTPVVGDWNGDGKTDLGVKRGGTFFLDLNGSGKWDAGDVSFSFGNASDLPVSGDWNGDGKDEIGVFRNGEWYLDQNGNRNWDGTGAGKDTYFIFGIANDLPFVGDWNGDGTDDPGILRGYTWFIDANGNRKWNGPGADLQFNFGNAGDKPLVGLWSQKTSAASGAQSDPAAPLALTISADSTSTPETVSVTSSQLTPASTSQANSTSSAKSTTRADKKAARKASRHSHSDLSSLDTLFANNLL